MPECMWSYRIKNHFKNQNIFVWVFFSVFVRDTGGLKQKRERSNYSGRNNIHLWPCVGNCYTVHLCVRTVHLCVCVWVHAIGVTLECSDMHSISLSIHFFLTQFFFLNPSSLTLPLPLGLISPRPPTRCTQHCKSAHQHTFPHVCVNVHTKPKGKVGRSKSCLFFFFSYFYSNCTFYFLCLLSLSCMLIHPHVGMCSYKATSDFRAKMMK